MGFFYHNMIDNYKYASQFKILISFHKRIESLEEIAGSYIDYRANYAEDLINDQPEFINGIEDLNLVDKNQDLIQYLLADLFPTALTQNKIKAATIPFYDITFK